MKLYVDASALAKRYLPNEVGATEVTRLIADAEQFGTALISRAEVSAALAKAVRMKWVSAEEGRDVLAAFRADWTSIFRLNLREVTVQRADELAWQYGLRGYDAVHLASALIWQEARNRPVTLATYDEALWQAAAQAGLRAWPEQLP